MTASHIGLIISLCIIGGGLVWMLVRTIRGKVVERRIVFLFIAVSVLAPILFQFFRGGKIFRVVTQRFPVNRCRG